MTIAGMEHPFGVPGGSRTHNAFQRPLLRRFRLPIAVTGTYMRRKTKTEILVLWPTELRRICSGRTRTADLSLNRRSICFVHYRVWRWTEESNPTGFRPPSVFKTAARPFRHHPAYSCRFSRRSMFQGKWYQHSTRGLFYEERVYGGDSERA